MKITTQTAREMLEVLEELRKELFQKRKVVYPYAEWERKRELARRRLRKLQVRQNGGRGGAANKIQGREAEGT
jgi:hypothetical protein